jgi:pyrroloquinoline quinone biosynthesis protein B
VSADGVRWFLLNASPDVRDQIGRLDGRPPVGVRQVPIEGVVTTDAELDHTLGLVLLREGGFLHLYSTGAVRQVLAQDSRLLPVVEAFSPVQTTDLPLESPVELRYRDGTPSGLTALAFAVPGDPPRFARQELLGHTVGLTLRDAATGGSCGFVPGCGAIDAALHDRLSGVDLLLFDGTFWTDDEMMALGISDRTARQLGHVPVSGPGGSLESLARLSCRHRVYTHINNSNPMLLEGSAQRQMVEKAGLQVGDDGMRFRI